MFDPARSAVVDGLLIELMTRDPEKSGDVARVQDASDRRILDAVCGAEPAYSAGPAWGGCSAGLPLVRIHRAGEGAPFDGLKPAGHIEPFVAAVDQSLVDGAPNDVVSTVSRIQGRGGLGSR